VTSSHYQQPKHMQTRQTVTLQQMTARQTATCHSQPDHNGEHD